MKTASVSELRTQFPKLEAWLRNGEQVEITKRGQRIALLVPSVTTQKRKLVKPDILARLRETWGHRVFNAEEVAEMRAAEFDREDG